jgi:signal transduction histidine kinase/DNA-binding response OmpR family regulator
MSTTHLKTDIFPSTGNSFFSFRFFFVVLLVSWTVVVGISLWYNLSRLQTHASDSAKIQALTAFEKDVVYRRWNSMHGGIFVSLGKDSPIEPNPYLPPKGREITDQNGTVYTKVNPAFMTRLVHEIGELRSGVQGHITSNKPIRPANAPDPWESAALKRLESDEATEVSEILPINGKPYLRYISGLVTEQSCLSCHAFQGYSLGDIRGGISVSVPMAPFYAAIRQSASTLRLSHGALWLVGILGISCGMNRLMRLVADMTARDQVEEALRQARDLAEKASQAKSYFLANMSHEIRTPLNGVIGMADILLRTNLTEEQAGMTATIKTSGDALLLVLNDILDISKVESGRVVLEVAPFNLRELLYAAIRSVTHIAYKKGVALILDIGDDVPERLLGDSTRIRQILLNLTNNALKFTEKGETRLTVRLVEREATGVRLHFAVSDTGIGIPADKHGSIFKAFEQADSSITRKYGGTGLGLAICASFLQLMHSSIKLESETGKGSTFSFILRLPLAADGGENPPPPSLAGKNILLADQHAASLELLVKALRQSGAEADAASTIDRLAVLAEKAPDAIVLGQRFVEEHYAALRRLREASPSAAKPLLFLMTEGPLPPDMRNHFKHLFDKPVRPDLFVRALAREFDGRAGERPAPAVLEHAVKPGREILLVEDVDINRMVATHMLEELGHTVSVACNGQEALDILAEKPFGIVLMDVQMPVMDGVSATVRLRELESRQPDRPAAVIIAMTANALKGDRDKYLRAGMDDYLSKPLHFEHLAAVLGKYT